MNISPKVQKIIDWRESFSILPDDYFFEIVRMYLGEVTGSVMAGASMVT